MSGFDQKIVLIVGEPDEVAIATGRKLAGAGTVITLCGDNGHSQLEAASASIRLYGNDTGWMHSELSGAEDARNVVGQMTEKYGRLDIVVVNLAAEARMQSRNSVGLDQTPYGSVSYAMHLIEAALPVLRANGQGRIVVIGSIDYLGAPEHAGLSSAYASLFGLTRSLALQIACDGVTVNTVVKGDIEDPAMVEEEKAKVLQSIPVKRLGQAEDVANAIGYFAADAARYVTGQTLFVCGGRSMHYSMSI